jgi:hypothetical protein
MCSYNKGSLTTSHSSVSRLIVSSVNGTYACENDRLLNGVSFSPMFVFTTARLRYTLRSSRARLASRAVSLGSSSPSSFLIACPDVMSDWLATHSTSTAANNGLDVRVMESI